MIVMVNGTGQEVGEGATLQDLLPDGARNRGHGVAIAHNGDVVPRRRWADVRVQAGDRVEILNAVGGG
ncbi:MAG: thiazole synthase [Actinomycetota bacterium]|jgi:sulfur carrier protein|nr:thiazole synthase [Actinomycetota bacterium]